METILEKENLILTKSKDFAIQIISFYHSLTEKKEFDIGRQILRSGTSIGANVRESQNAQSTADFISKLSIALKEADETAYWIEIIQESGIACGEKTSQLYDSCKELIKLLVTIIKKAKENAKK